MEVYTKKSTAFVYDLARAFSPKLTRNTSQNTCWEVIAESTGLELEVSQDSKGKTVIYIYKNNEKVDSLEYTDWSIYDRKELDWKWDTLYQDVLQRCLKVGIIKRPRRSTKTGEVIVSQKTKKLLATPLWTPEQAKLAKDLKQKIYNRKGTDRAKPFQAQLDSLIKHGLKARSVGKELPDFDI